MTLSFTSSSNAALIVEMGILKGATGVQVGDRIFDVEFIDGICVDLFNGCDSSDDFDFTDQQSATAAAQALLDQVFIDSPLGDFDSDPTLTLGCANTVRTCFTIIAYSLDTNGLFRSITANNSSGTIADITNTNGFSPVI